jgi:hypothetical protein
MKIQPLENELYDKIELLNRKVWENRLGRSAITSWLDNFNGRCQTKDVEKLHMLFLLSNFLYFGDAQMRELLKAAFRDLYKYPIVERLRRENQDTRNLGFIQKRFDEHLQATRFLGIGNPSESGCHMLYYFRQMNSLPKDLFINAYQMFKRDKRTKKRRLAYGRVKKFVFLDDFCGSGSQVIEYAKAMVQEAKELNPQLEIEYHVLFGCRKGVNRVKFSRVFDRVSCLVELDETFTCFGRSSRFFHAAPLEIKKQIAKDICLEYGSHLWPNFPLGFGNCQLLIGFHHNTPDNTLPIFWWDESAPPWQPIFKRYPKIVYF